MYDIKRKQEFSNKLNNLILEYKDIGDLQLCDEIEYNCIKFKLNIWNI